MLELQRPELTELKPRITVIGVGGAGGNAVNNMISCGLEGVDFVVANTDAQALSSSAAEARIQLGLKITQGLGAGARPEIGRAAAEETMNDIEAALEGAHMCFITAGMGGGTGTGAAPVVAQAARDRGILTVGVVTKPFAFEGARRARAAEEGIAELQKHVDTLIVIPNQNLFLIANANTTFKEAFAMADQVLHQGVRGITDLMVMPGLINLDFADIRTVMQEMGKAMMGTGEAEGDNRAIEAAEKAIANPLLDEVSMRGAKAVIINITGGNDMTLMEFDEAANHIREMVDGDANIIVGSAFNEGLEGRLRVSVVATGIDAAAPAQSREAKPQASMSGFGSVAGGLSSTYAQPPKLTPAPAPAPTPAPAPEPVAETPEPETAEQEEPETAAEANAGLPLDAPAPQAEPEDEEQGFSDNVRPLRAAPPEADDRESLVERQERQERPQPAPRARAVREEREEEQRGPTLFERMMNLNRGPAKKEERRQMLPEPEDKADTTEDPLEIPRFFRRQVND